MGWTNKPVGNQKPRGMVNNVRVKCSRCGSQQYIKPGNGFVCGSCGQRH